MLGLCSLFGQPPAYVGPGQPTVAPSWWGRGLFGLLATPPVYVGGGQPPATTGGSVVGFALSPEPPRYVAPTPTGPSAPTELAPAPRELPRIPEIERRIWDRE